MRGVTLPAAIVLLIIGTGCGDDDSASGQGGADGGSGRDAAAEGEAGAGQGGEADAGQGGEADAAVPDAAERVDAATYEDGGRDATEGVDAEVAAEMSLQEKCESVVDTALGTDCADKPDDRQDSIDECLRESRGYCGEAMVAYLDCSVNHPEYGCNEDDRPVAVECGSGLELLMDCMGEYGNICDLFCEDFVSAGCSNAPSKQQCADQCQGVKRSGCGEQMDAYLKCAREGAEITCDSDGEPVVEACADAYRATGECVEGVRESCVAACTEATAADCAAGSDQDYCGSHCQDAYFGQCPAEFDALLQCVDGEAFTCDGDDRPVVAACADRYAAWQGCTEDGVWP